MLVRHDLAIPAPGISTCIAWAGVGSVRRPGLIVIVDRCDPTILCGIHKDHVLPVGTVEAECGQRRYRSIEGIIVGRTIQHHACDGRLAIAARAALYEADAARTARLCRAVSVDLIDITGPL